MKISGAVLDAIGIEPSFAEHSALRIASLSLDDPGPTELQVQIDRAGICHSDLSVINGSRPRPTPMLLGHEATGLVTKVGEDIDDISPGQRVIMTFLPRCSDCEACATQGKLPCTRGSASNSQGVLLEGESRLSENGQTIHHHLGVSGFADHAVVDRRSVVPVDGDIPADVAAVLGCAVLTGGGAMINDLSPSPEESVIVVGLGGVGMAAVLVALSLGARVIAVDTVDDKRAQAIALGADAAYNPTEAIEKGIEAAKVLEAAGNARAFECAVRLLAPGGHLVTVGLPDPAATSAISPLALVAGARTLSGSYLGSAIPSRDIPIFIDMWREGRLPLEKLVSNHIPLSQINEAFDRLHDGKALRQIIVFDHKESS